MDTLAEYLDYYGFKTEPFVDGVGFYAGAEREDALVQIQHWCDFGAGVIVAEAGRGLGKSALCQEFLKRQDPSAVVSLIDGPVLAGLDQMLLLLAAELGVELLEEQTSGAMLGQLRQHVQGNRDASGEPFLVMVDNAHRLEDRVLIALMSLLQGEQAGASHINVVLFAEEGLSERLRRFDVVDVNVNQLSLRPLNEGELVAYLDHQLQLAGYEGPELFSQEEAKELRRATEGKPAQINVLAQNLLINRLYSKPEPRAGLPLLHLFGAAALIAALVVVFFYRDDLINTEPTEFEEAPIVVDAPQSSAGQELESDSGSLNQAGVADTPSVVDDTEALINEALTPSEPVLADAPSALGDEGIAPVGLSSSEENPAATELAEAVSQAAEAQSEELAEEIQNLPSSTAQTPDLSVQTASGPSSATVDADGAAIVNEAAVGPAPGQEPVVAMEMSDLNENTGSAVDYASYSPEQLASMGIDPGFDLSVFTADEQYLMRLPDTAYVLQLIAVRTTEQVEKFLSRQPNRSELRIFNRERKGKSWHVIVLPGYDTWDAVQAGQSNLPSRQRRDGAWPRSLKIIKADIRSFRGI